MGKGNKPMMVLAALRDKKLTGEIKKGCNSPQGCLLNEDPPIDCSRNGNFVKVICDNEKCPRNQYLHQQCYDHWEELIIIGVQKCQARTRDFTDQQVRCRMWSRIWDISYRYCKCICGGYLKRADAVELVEPPQAAAAAGGGQQNKKKNKQAQAENGGAIPKTNPLPKLNQSTNRVYNNHRVSAWTAAGGTTINLGPQAPQALRRAAKYLNTSTESLLTSDSGAIQDGGHIPGLFIDKEKKTKNQRLSSTSSTDEQHGYEVMKTSSFTSPWMSPVSPLADESGTDDGWHVISSKKGKSDDLAPWFSQSVDILDPVHDAQEDGDVVQDDVDDHWAQYDIADDGAQFDSLAVIEEPQEEVEESKDVNEYVGDLTAHIQLSDPDMPYIYRRDLFEIQCLLEEMSTTSKE